MQKSERRDVTKRKTTNAAADRPGRPATMQHAEPNPTT